MNRNRHRLPRWMTARVPTMRAVRAWRRLLPDWTPTLEQLQELDRMPSEHQEAVRIVSHDWSYNDARWDVLVALLEWERREERKRREAADALARECDRSYCGADHSDGSDCDTYSNVVSMDQEYERLRYDSEVTTVTYIPESIRAGYERMREAVWDTKPVERSDKPVIQLVPKEGTQRTWTVRHLSEKNDD